MRGSQLFDSLLWFAPIVLFLAYLQSSVSLRFRKVFKILLAFILSMAFFVLLRGTWQPYYKQPMSWLYIVAMTIALLLLFFPKEPRTNEEKPSLYFATHPDFLFLLLIHNGLWTSALLFGHQIGLHLPLSHKILYALLYTCYFTLPLYALYAIGYRFAPKRAVRYIVWIEGIRLWLLALNLLMFTQIHRHLTSTETFTWLTHWKLRAKSHDWNIHQFIGCCVGAFLLFMGLQISLQWLYRRMNKGRGTEATTPETEPLDVGTLRFWSNKGRTFVLVGLLACFATSLVWLGVDFRVESYLYDRFPLFGKTHISFQGWDSVEVKKRLALRKKSFRYPRRAAKKLVKKARKRPDILVFVSRTLSSDALHESRMPQWTSIVARQPSLLSYRHLGGNGKKHNGLQTLLHSLHPYRLDRVQHRTPWALDQLRALGYQVELMTNARDLKKTKGFDRVVIKKYKVGSRKPFEWIAKRLALGKPPQVRTRPRPPARPAVRKPAPPKRRPDHPTTRAASKPTTKPTTQPGTLRPKIRVPIVVRPRPIAPKTRLVVVARVPRKPVALFVYLDVLPPRLQRHVRRCYYYKRRLKRFDRNMAWLWKQTLRGRVQKDLAVVWTGGKGWMESGILDSTNWLRNGHVPLVMFYPGMRRSGQLNSGHVDIFPTLFGALGVRTKPSSFSDGRSLLGRSRHGQYVMSDPLAAKSSMALFSHPYSFAFNWKNQRSLLVGQARSTTGQAVTLDNRFLKRQLRTFRRSFRRFSPKGEMWYKRPIRTTQPPGKRNKQRVPCANFMIYSRHKRKLPFVQYPFGNVRIGKFVQVMGYDINKHTATKGSKIRVRITIKVLRPLGTKSMIFVHLSDEHKWFKNPGSDPFRSYPGKRWKKGEIIQTVVTFKMPKAKSVRVLLGIWSRKAPRSRIYGARGNKRRLEVARIYGVNP